MSITYQEGGIGTRVMTDYSERDVKPFGSKKIVSELKKKLMFPVQDEYRIEAFKILRIIHKTSEE